MALIAILKERQNKKRASQKKALHEIKILAKDLMQKFQLDTIYLYGSILTNSFGPASDIDIVIKGLNTEDFFKAYAFLIKKSGYKIDLKPYEDLSEGFREKVLNGGLKIG